MSQSLIHYATTFEWKNGETPLSSWQAPFYACVAYCVVILVLRKLMQNREPLKLKSWAIFHNLLLSGFSLAYVLVMSYETIMIGWQDGALGLFCEMEKHSHGTYYFFLYVFYLSKYYELLDTVFLVLTKKPLQLLHVYHHPATLVLCYICLETGVAPQWLCTLTNATVHTVMYFYYFLTLLGKTVWWKKYITTMQIIQFVMDVGFNHFWMYYTYQRGKECSGGWTGYWFGQGILLSYLLLFIEFFFKTYHGRSSGKSKPTEKKE